MNNRNVKGNGLNNTLNNSTNDYADAMIGRIIQIINEEKKQENAIESGIVNSINPDGTVNVCFPPDYAHTFNKISNQTPFELQVGDAVEVLLKNKSYSNCWIIAKHKKMLQDVTNSDLRVNDNSPFINLQSSNISANAFNNVNVKVEGTTLIFY